MSFGDYPINEQLVDGIGATIAELLAEAEERRATPLEAARQLASERLETALAGASRRPHSQT